MYHLFTHSLIDYEHKDVLIATTQNTQYTAIVEPI